MSSLNFNNTKLHKDWYEEQKKREIAWKAELAERREYFENITPDYENICKLIGYCIYQYVGDKTFKPEILMQDYDFLNMEFMKIITENYYKYIELIRQQPYMIKQIKKRSKPIYGIMYAPWSFKDRWKRIIERLVKLGFVNSFTAELYGTKMKFYKFNEEKILELKKEAFVEFV